MKILNNEDEEIMLFVIDVGNSHTVVGVFENNTLKAQWRIASERHRTPDEIAVQFTSLFMMAGISKDSISGIILSSVVPSLEAAWVNCCNKHFSSGLKKPPFVVNHESINELIGVDIDYPKEVGADRLVNSIAGWYQCKTDLIVIDFGTAITFDCVTRDCNYIGGTILPGVAISLEALSSRAAKLPHIDISTKPQHAIGKNTEDAMKSGILHGYGAMIDGLITILSKEINTDGQDVNTIATGGMANIVIPYSGKVSVIDQLLTLKGLNHIYTTLYG